MVHWEYTGRYSENNIVENLITPFSWRHAILIPNPHFSVAEVIFKVVKITNFISLLSGARLHNTVTNKRCFLIVANLIFQKEFQSKFWPYFIPAGRKISTCLFNWIPLFSILAGEITLTLLLSARFSSLTLRNYQSTVQSWLVVLSKSTAMLDSVPWKIQSCPREPLIIKTGSQLVIQEKTEDVPKLSCSEYGLWAYWSWKPVRGQHS